MSKAVTHKHRRGASYLHELGLTARKPTSGVPCHLVANGKLDPEYQDMKSSGKVVKMSSWLMALPMEAQISDNARLH